MPSYGNHNVDEKYSAILEPNLFLDSVLIPGVTYTDKFQGDAASGAVKFHKLGVAAIDPSAPAQDFTDVDVADALITLPLNNSFRRSRKIFRVAANAVAFDLAEQELSTAVQEVSEGWQKSGVALMAAGATATVDIVVITDSNVKQYIIDYRKKIKDAKGTANFVFVNTTVYAAILKAAGSEFTPTRNEAINNTGNVGMWLGLLIIEVNILNESAAKYIDAAGVVQTVDLTKVDLIIGDYRAFGVATNLEAMRLKDSERFVGTLAQVEINSGFVVTNSARIQTKLTVAL